MSPEIPNQPDEPGKPATGPGISAAAGTATGGGGGLVATSVAVRTDGQGVAVRVDHRHPRLRAPLDTAGHLGRHPHEDHQRRCRTLAVMSFVLIGMWAIVGTVVGMMAGLSVTSTTDRTAAPPPSGLVAPTTLPATV
jgi:hypothetical protein